MNGDLEVPDIEEVRAYLADENGLAVVSTAQADGRVLSTVTNCGVMDRTSCSTCRPIPTWSARSGIFRVADIQQVYEDWSAKGATFVTAPIDRGPEIRCYMRDPDGHLIEVGQATAVLDAATA